MILAMQHTSAIHEPFAIVAAIIVAAIILWFQSGSTERKVDRTKVACIKFKSDCIDKLECYESDEIETLLNQKDTKDYKKLKDIAVEFDEFCLRFEEDKFNKRALYEELRGGITEHLQEIVAMITEEKEATDDFFEWYVAENTFHDQEEENKFLKIIEQEKEAEKQRADKINE